MPLLTKPPSGGAVPLSLEWDSASLSMWQLLMSCFAWGWKYSHSSHLARPPSKKQVTFALPFTASSASASPASRFPSSQECLEQPVSISILLIYGASATSNTCGLQRSLPAPLCRLQRALRVMAQRDYAGMCPRLPALFEEQSWSHALWHSSSSMWVTQLHLVQLLGHLRRLKAGLYVKVATERWRSLWDLSAAHCFCQQASVQLEWTSPLTARSRHPQRHPQQRCPGGTAPQGCLPALPGAASSR